MPHRLLGARCSEFRLSCEESDGSGRVESPDRQQEDRLVRRDRVTTAEMRPPRSWFWRTTSTPCDKGAVDGLWMPVVDVTKGTIPEEFRFTMAT